MGNGQLKNSRHDNGTRSQQKNAHKEHKHSEHHGHMIEDFRKRFWISVVLTIPILLLSPLIQQFLGIKGTISFRGDVYVLFTFSTLTYFYGGFPFLKGFFNEMRKLQPEMMTLIALAISVAYFYSSAVVFGVKGEVFFWELARNIQAILFDKTGTLTKGEFGVTEVISFDNQFDEKEILKYAAAVESESEHPIAQGIVKSSEDKYELKEFNSIPGKGAEGKVNGKEVKVVSPGYNVIAIPLAAGVLYSQGIILSPAIGAVLMSISTIVVAINAKMLKVS